MITIYLDFDGTVVEHTYPAVGRENPFAMEVIRKLSEAGHEIILNTMRVHFKQRDVLDAIEYLYEMGFNDYIVGENKQQPPRWNPKNALLTGEMYIDDAAPEIPLTPAIYSKGDMVDWKKIDKEFEELGFYGQS